jgi:xylulokinase
VTAFGLDVGTSSVKGLAVGAGGEVLARAEVAHDLSTPRPGWSEQRPEDWWAGAERVLAELAAAAGAPSGIGLSGQMHGLVALDGADRVVRPALLWNDQRTTAECAEIERRLGGPEGVAKATGNAALTGLTAPKLLWLERHEPGAYARVRSVMLPKDYVRLRLTGERATDVTDASGTLWFDVRERRWSERMLDALGLDRAWLPPALESAEATGATRDGVPVAAGAGDQGAGALGVGVDGTGGDGIASVVLGTSGVVLHCLPGYGADPASGIQASAHAVPGGWFAMGVILSAAGSLRWLRDVLDVPYETLLAEAERWPPGCEGLYFLPYLTGERAPHADPGARGAFVGLELRHDRGALVRAVLEGVAYALRDVLDVVAGLGGVGGSVSLGRLSGGGGRGDLWPAILASVLEVPLERTAVDEGAAYGAALLGGVAGGVWPSPQEAVAACVRPVATIEPDGAWSATYAELRPRYRELYPALRP